MGFELIRTSSSAIVQWLDKITASGTSAVFLELAKGFYRYVMTFINGVYTFLNTSLDEMVSLLAINSVGADNVVLEWLFSALGWLVDNTILLFLRLIGIDTSLPFWVLLLVSPLIIFAFVTMFRIVGLVFGSKD